MATIKMVAQRAGVSPSTVSRIITNANAYVSGPTREAVLKAIDELHYVPNSNARRLRSNRTYNIGLLIASITNDAYPPIIEGIEEYARKHNYNIILCITHDDLEIERFYLEKLKNNYVDGFLVCSTTMKSVSIYQLKRENIPTVLVSRSASDDFDAVVVDDYEGAYNAVKYLASTGKKRIAVISGNTQIKLYEKRLAGYRAAIQNEGLEADEKLIIYENGGKDMLYRTIKDFIASNPIDAVFATSDEKAIIAMRAISDLGMSVPKDISVVGFDNIKLSKLINPPLSTVAQPFHEMGQHAIQKLIAKIENKEDRKPEIDVLKTELIIRSSTM